MTYVKSKFDPSRDKVWYAYAVFGEEEQQAVIDCLKRGRLGPGPLTTEFEQKISALFAKDHGVMTNSGSSANLIASELLNLREGDEVITTACSFPTTVAPILQKGATPVVADSIVGTYNLDLDYLEEMTTPRTKAVMVAHLFGHPNDMVRLREHCDKYRLSLIEDSCDALGTTLHGRPIGYWSDISTTSFYASHVITSAGGGGMICLRDQDWERRARILRDWGRAGDDDEDIDRRFEFEVDGIPYDSKFTYGEIGYNLKSVELCAAFGLAQLRKLDKFNEARRRNFKILTEFFQAYADHLIPPYDPPEAEVSWLSYPLTIRDGAPFERIDLLKFLEKSNIQTRLLMAGNMFRHPAYRDAKVRVVGNLNNVDKIMRDSFVIGLHQALTEEMMDYTLSKFEEFLKRL